MHAIDSICMDKGIMPSTRAYQYHTGSNFFSKPKLTKTYLSNAMSQGSNSLANSELAIISIEEEIANSIDYDDDFTNKKQENKYSINFTVFC